MSFSVPELGTEETTNSFVTNGNDNQRNNLLRHLAGEDGFTYNGFTYNFNMPVFWTVLQNFITKICACLCLLLMRHRKFKTRNS